MLDAGNRLTPSQALLVEARATRALDHAHRQGFVHRDIKPANLLFGDDGRLRIADFGLAQALAEAAWTKARGAMVGTARCASPEQARGEPVDGQADVYALGLVLVEAVTGKVPFAADTTIGTLMARIGRRACAGAPVRSRKSSPAPASPSPASRPDAGEFGVGLMAAAEELDRPAPLPLAKGVIEASPRPRRRRCDPAARRQRRHGTGRIPCSSADGSVPDERCRSTRSAPAPAAVAEGPAGPAAGGRLVAGGWYSQTVLVPSHEVPQLVGLDQAAAAEACAERGGWELEVREGRDDASVAGQVLDRTHAR